MDFLVYTPSVNTYSTVEKHCDFSGVSDLAAICRNLCLMQAVAGKCKRVSVAGSWLEDPVGLRPRLILISVDLGKRKSRLMDRVCSGQVPWEPLSYLLLYSSHLPDPPSSVHRRHQGGNKSVSDPEKKGQNKNVLFYEGQRQNVRNRIPYAK